VTPFLLNNSGNGSPHLLVSVFFHIIANPLASFYKKNDPLGFFPSDVFSATSLSTVFVLHNFQNPRSTGLQLPPALKGWGLAVLAGEIYERNTWI
jgi:hypothetical protein